MRELKIFFLSYLRREIWEKEEKNDNVYFGFGDDDWSQWKSQLNWNEKRSDKCHE